MCMTINRVGGRFRSAFLLALVVILIILPGAAGAGETLAIMPFDNNSVTDRAELEPLRQGLAAILTTDLSRNSGGLKLVEREKIASVLKEIAMGQTGAIDQSTATQVGRILGARNIAFGSFMALGKTVRIDLRIIVVETGELLVAESVSGSSNEFIALASRLAGIIAESLKVSLASPGKSSSSNIEAAVFFSRGIEALDGGDKKAARRWFNKSVELDSGFKARVDSLLN